MHTSQNSLQFIGCVLLIGGGIGLTMAADPGNQEPIRLSRETCTSLQGFSLPSSAIGLPNSGAFVQTAVFVAASENGNINGDFCKVIGIVKSRNPGSPNRGFEVNLPAAWNRRALQMGGGGYDGSLVTALTQYSNQAPNSDTPLKQGYVTLGSDGGHKGKPGFDGTFGLDDEALMNYGKQSVKKALMPLRPSSVRHTDGGPIGSTLSAAHRAGMKRWMPRRVIRRIMTGWSPITPRITLRCCTWDRSTRARLCTQAEAPDGSIRRRRS
jgi:hypothetical protein